MKQKIAGYYSIFIGISVILMWSMILSNEKPPNLSNCEKLEIIVTNTGISEVPVWVEMMDSLYYFKYSGQQVRKQN